MAWIKRQTGWIKEAPGTSRGRGAQGDGGQDVAKRKLDSRVYSVADAARFLRVDKRTVMKWLTYDEDEPASAIIPPEAWFKLPNGYIRIEEWILIKLKNP